MLQEAVDALIDNGARRDKNVATATSRRKLRSLADMLKGKQGRFRQNLLGKRVDYSGRSVIVVGPELSLHECGLPKMMALELFKPFVISKLILGGLAHNVKSASRMIERSKNEVWDALDEVIKDKYVLLNRAPTLHRLGIQAFKPVLIEGKAIQIHPLVCAAFNADFDGDQMAVHVPLSTEAQREAREIMLSTKNLLKPAAGEPVVKPSQDMVLGIYWMTRIEKEGKEATRIFADKEEAITAYDSRLVGLRELIKVKTEKELVETTVGRLLFNEILPKEIPFVNEVLDIGRLTELVNSVFKICGQETTVTFVDKIKLLGFRYSTRSGLSFSMDDLAIPSTKENILKESEAKEAHIHNQYLQGLITEEEKTNKIIEVWTEAREKIQEDMKEQMNAESSSYVMMTSGARGKMGQFSQMAGMKGLVVNAVGRIIELPVKSNYKEGLSSLEYFISTHGARKGLSDTALKTSDSGYLTRRLVDVSQDVIVTEKDCGTKEHTLISRAESKTIGEDFFARLKGRVLADNLVATKSGEILAKKGSLIDDDILEQITKNEINEVYIRAISNCKAEWGVCQKCYGADLAKGGLIALGEAVGIIAAQSIGEPGTQLTMRTFHAGGVAGADITQGLPRVEELFEARAPKGQAILSEIPGKIFVETAEGKHKITVMSEEVNEDTYDATGYEIEVKNNKVVEVRDILATKEGKKPIKAKNAGIVKVKDHQIRVIKEADAKNYEISSQVGLLARDGDIVERGQALTEGSWNLSEALKLLGELAVQRYIVKEVQQTYASEGQTINDKHIEIIIRQMFSRCRIDEANDTPFVVGEIVSRTSLNKANKKAKGAGGKAAESTNLLLPISKVALTTDSFLSAASFQETSKVLIGASVAGKVDELKGLKENVIIGKLIPAGTGFDESLTKKS